MLKVTQPVHVSAVTLVCADGYEHKPITPFPAEWIIQHRDILYRSRFRGIGIPLFVPTEGHHLFVIPPNATGEMKLGESEPPLSIELWKSRSQVTRHPKHGLITPCVAGLIGDLILPSGARIIFQCLTPA